MNTTVQISSRDLHTLVKRHVTTDELLKRYGFSSQEELFARIREITPGESRMFISKLQKADKKGISRGSKSSNSKQTAMSDIPMTHATEKFIGFSTPVNSELSTLSVTSSFESFTEMQKKESLMSDKLIQLELSHRQLQKDRRSLIGELEKIRDKLESLYQTIDECETSASSIVEKFNQKADEMTLLSEEIRDRKSELETLRRELQEAARKVIIFIYTDGSIELETPMENIPTVSDNEIDMISFIAKHTISVKDLTLKQIQALAKLDKLLQKLTDTKISYETVFDDDTMQDAYLSVTTVE